MLLIKVATYASVMIRSLWDHPLTPRQTRRNKSDFNQICVENGYILMFESNMAYLYYVSCKQSSTRLHDTNFIMKREEIGDFHQKVLKKGYDF